MTLTTSQHATASGGFSDVWKATDEDGEVFSIKVFRMYESNAAQVKKVGEFLCAFSCRRRISDRISVKKKTRNFAGRSSDPGG